MSTARQLWIAPTFDGPETGGTIYNRSLFAALQALNVPCEAWDLDTFCSAKEVPATAIAWLDSLYLKHASDVRTRLSASTRFGLVMHYLPSLVREGGVDQRTQWRALEKAALAATTVCIAPSATLAESLRELSASAHVLCIEPGIPDGLRAPGTITAPPSVLMVANLTKNKGVLKFLEALAALVRPDDAFDLTIIGHDDFDPAYAAACRSCVERVPQLRARVSWAGGRAHRTTLDTIASSALLVSASRMESYGMAMAEARALGVPILARCGGHAMAHVDTHAGGELVSDEAELARALLHLLRHPTLLPERTAAARRATRRRSWRDAALELCRQLASL